MPLIVYKGHAPLDVCSFGADVERSSRGALVLQPGRTSVVTAGERDHLAAIGIQFLELLPDAPEEPSPAPKVTAVARTTATTQRRSGRGRP